jgi:secondary thiamine-phosphate synthase enzyme
MEACAPASAATHATHTTIRVCTTRPTEFVDITDQVDDFIAASAIRTGLVNVQSLHTTSAIVVNEHEPLLLSDFATLLGRAAPFRAFYRHDDAAARTVNLMPDERANGHAHCRALLLGAAASLNVVEGRLRLGRWQRVFLVELDGPRERDVAMVVTGERAG